MKKNPKSIAKISVLPILFVLTMTACSSGNDDKSDPALTSPGPIATDTNLVDINSNPVGTDTNPVATDTNPVDTNTNQNPIDTDTNPVDTNTNQNPLDTDTNPVDTNINQNPIDTDTNPVDTNTNQNPIDTGTNPSDTDPNQLEPVNNPPIAEARLPNFSQSFVPGDVITLQGSNSFDYDGTVVSYKWSQLSGASQIVLSSPDAADTTFIAPISFVSETYVFQLDVADDKAATNSTTVNITIEPSVTCASCTPEQINTLYEGGSIKSSRYGQLAAIDGSVLAVANQVSNKIEFHDLASGTLQKAIQLNSAPDLLYFQSNRRLLYASLVGTTAIAQINIDSGTTQTFQISGLVRSLTGGSERVYYSLQNQFPDNKLYSIDPAGTEQSHGLLLEDLVAYNATLNEIINADSESTGGGLHRYGFSESGQLEQRQTADDESSGFFGPVPFAKNISISSDGQQMAIASTATAGGNSFSVPIQDIPPGNVQISNGAWLSEDRVAWVEFSANDKHIVTVHYSFEQGAGVSTIYDATSKVRVLEKVLSTCEESYDEAVQSGFTKDNQHFYAKINCGFDGTESVISYSKFPEF